MLNPLKRTIVTRYGKIISGDRDDFEESEDFILYKEWPWFWRTERIYKETIAEDRQTLNLYPVVVAAFLTLIISIAVISVLVNLWPKNAPETATATAAKKAPPTPPPHQASMITIFGLDMECGADTGARPQLEAGDSGEMVRLAQKLLGDYYKADIDGEFGDKTKNAVKRFQGAHGLPQDGIIGQATWKLLDIPCSTWS